jgi:hypothetical protein
VEEILAKAKDIMGKAAQRQKEILNIVDGKM